MSTVDKECTSNVTELAKPCLQPPSVSKCCGKRNGTDEEKASQSGDVGGTVGRSSRARKRARTVVASPSSPGPVGYSSVDTSWAEPTLSSNELAIGQGPLVSVGLLQQEKYFVEEQEDELLRSRQRRNSRSDIYNLLNE
jgi:hypothetical protein